MKKLLVLAMVTLFTAALAAPSAFAFGDCANKSNKGTKTAEQTPTQTDAA